MATEEPGSGPAAAPGLLASLRNLAANAVAILRTRLELLATEVEEESLRLARIAFWLMVAVVFLMLGLMTFTLLAIVLFWDTYRVSVIIVLTVVYFGVSIGLASWVRSRLHERPKLFSASLAEFAKDHDQLTSRHVP